jgi:hypothetical protein
MQKQIKKKKTIKQIAFENYLSDVERDALIEKENETQRKKIDENTKMDVEKVNSLYRKYFGVDMKNRV